MINNLISIAKLDGNLRPYQKDSKVDIYEAWTKADSVLFQMPTGTGKTRLFSSIIKDIRNISIQERILPQPRILVLAHRSELIEQIADTLLLKYNIVTGIIKSGLSENQDALVQVASVQSLSRRLARWKKIPFGFIIIDEAHHALAKTYLKICAEFPSAKILGVTATPYRLNKESFRKIFSRLVTSRPVQEFIDMGYLSKYQYYSIRPYAALQNDINNICEFGANGDFAETELMRVCDNAKIRAQLIKSYKDYANGKKGIIYTINKVHNRHIAQQYQEIGVRVATIDSGTPALERKQIVRDFKNGKLDIICNVNIFSEGFDCPDIEFIQLARPTLSLALYLQQVGRALRKSENKEYAIILDNVGSYNRFGLPNKKHNWEYYFNGRILSLSVMTPRKKTQATVNKDIREADEEMVLVDETNTIEDTPQNEETAEYNINDILATWEQFPLGLRKYIYKLLRERGENDYIDDIIRPFSQVYYTVEDYISDLEDLFDYDCVLTNSSNEAIAQNIYENTYLFQANGKYGVCRLKDEYKILDVYNEVKESLSLPSVSKYFDEIIAPIYDKIGVPNGRDCFIAVRDGKYGVINGFNLTELIPFIYDELQMEGNYVTYYIARKKDKVGILDHEGNKYTSICYDMIFPRICSNGFICEQDGRYHIIKNKQHIYNLDCRVKSLVNELEIYSLSDSKGERFITNKEGEILFPYGAREIFLTNRDNEICLEFNKHHMLLDFDLNCKTSLIEGLLPNKAAITQEQKEKRKKGMH